MAGHSSKVYTGSRQIATSAAATDLSGSRSWLTAGSTTRLAMLRGILPTSPALTLSSLTVGTPLLAIVRSNVYFEPGTDAKYCDTCISRVSVYPLAYFKNHVSELHRTYITCGSFFLWRKCHISCNFGSIHDVIACWYRSVNNCSLTV